ncbi:MAG: M1 family metallopeptidase, partial [Candidatus Micrarchaeota archaeon]
MQKKEFKYYLQDFPPLSAKPLHMNLTFDIHDDYTDVQNHMEILILKGAKTLSLDARDLEIKDVKCAESEVDYSYNKEEGKLAINFKNPLNSSDTINLFTHAICRPTKNMLEGLYYDQTPKGAPPTQITQCQQWGFSRITPCFDDMQAKCTYTTRITADSRYTHILSNGDLLKKKTGLSNSRSEVMYTNTRTPMAPYLFFLGAGTYEQHERIFEYPDGSQFFLQLLVPPGSDAQAAKEALEILHDGIMWIHIFTGEEAYTDLGKRQQLFDLIKKREKMRESNESPIEIRKEVAALAEQLKLGYQYTGTIYREIAMQNSNFGGMENVGNTTVVANRIMPSPKMPDSVFEYLIAVKAHEFYHNLNGSEVTGASPFELWLNEAVTCTIEHKYTEYVSSGQYARLGEAMRIISPDGGTLDYDSGSMTMPIIPKGFNMPDDLITEVTYSKAPQFVRMVESTMGKENFAKA